MSQKLRYALIGCGRIAPNHIAAVMNNQDKLELCAVCDPVAERMEEVLSPVPEASVLLYAAMPITARCLKKSSPSCAPSPPKAAIMLPSVWTLSLPAAI